MIVAGIRFALGIGIGFVLFGLLIVMVCTLVFRFEGLAQRRGWFRLSRTIRQGQSAGARLLSFKAGPRDVPSSKAQSDSS